eukprot:TRINITY_DN1249_c0_g1_i4.p1 TRINITY_DN1249_c0_g1~~TRINITY_DN1249_c0_g1_i4.p1  ORF type:complete len:343 (+),score=24.86 TRINITY_DN1249_c0_g1_i4:596-1624(+)
MFLCPQSIRSRTQSHFTHIVVQTPPPPSYTRTHTHTHKQTATDPFLAYHFFRGRPPYVCVSCVLTENAVFKPTPEQLAALSWRNFAAVPPEYVQANLFVIMAIEHGCFMVGIYGYGRHLVAPTDVEKLKVLTSSMLHGEVLRTVLDTWQQVTPFKSYIDASSYVKRFEKLQPGDWPENFIALGDAVSAFNPQYGQGMTASALESVAIGDVLRKHLTEHYTRDWCGVALQCQKAIAPVVAEFWATGATEDLMRPTTTVVRGPGPSTAGKLKSLVGSELAKYCLTSNEENMQAFWRVTMMAASPSTLMRPSILLPTFARCLRIMFFGRPEFKLTIAPPQDRRKV